MKFYWLSYSIVIFAFIMGLWLGQYLKAKESNVAPKACEEYNAREYDLGSPPIKCIRQYMDYAYYTEQKVK